MSFTTDLANGVAEYLAANGIGTWDPDAIGTSTLVRGPLPSELAAGVGITPYNLQPDHSLSDVVQPVQLLIRGDLDFVDDTADAIFDVFEGAVNLTLNGIRVPAVTLYSDVRMGVDGNGRHERALNYYLAAMRPSAHRFD